MPKVFRPRLAVAILALVFAPSAAAAAPPTILVKFKESTGAAGRIEAHGDDALGRTANGVAPPPPPPPPPVLPVTNTPDTTAPVVRVYPVTGRRGRTVRLTYRVRDDRGRTAEQISVYRGRARIARLRRTLRPTENASTYWVTWRAPWRAMRGRFCVRAADGAGNSATSCASLRVR